mgnify:CR=1 FL=1
MKQWIVKLNSSFEQSNIANLPGLGDASLKTCFLIIAASETSYKRNFCDEVILANIFTKIYEADM